MVIYKVLIADLFRYEGKRTVVAAPIILRLGVRLGLPLSTMGSAVEYVLIYSILSSETALAIKTI